MDPAHARKQDGECSLLQHDEVLGGAIMRRDYASVAGEDTFVVEDLCGEKETSDERGVPIKLCAQERLRAQTMGGQLGVGRHPNGLDVARTCTNDIAMPVA